MSKAIDTYVLAFYTYTRMVVCHIYKNVLQKKGVEMKTQQVLEKGLVWVAVSLVTMLVIILMGTTMGFTIPPVHTGELLRFEFIGNVKESFTIPEISYLYWYLIAPSFVYAARCIFGFCTQLDEESKSDMWLNVKFMLAVVLVMVLLVYPAMYWIAFVKYSTKVYVLDMYAMIVFGAVVTLLSVLLALAIFGIFFRFIDFVVLTVVAVTVLVGVNSILLGLYSYQQSILEVGGNSIVLTLGTFVLVCMLFAPLVFIVTLLRVMWRKLF